jgi:hypothetical protein
VQNRKRWAAVVLLLFTILHSNELDVLVKAFCGGSSTLWKVDHAD